MFLFGSFWLSIKIRQNTHHSHFQWPSLVVYSGIRCVDRFVLFLTARISECYIKFHSLPRQLPIYQNINRKFGSLKWLIEPQSKHFGFNKIHHQKWSSRTMWSTRWHFDAKAFKSTNCLCHLLLLLSWSPPYLATFSTIFVHYKPLKNGYLWHKSAEITHFYCKSVEKNMRNLNLI